MSAEKVTPSLDRAKVAEAMGGELIDGSSYGRVVVDGRTRMYVKKASLAVPTALVSKAPAKLGTFKPEKSSAFSNVAVADTAAAVAVAKYVAAQLAKAAAEAQA
jgi:hypothetical protein